MEHLFDLVPRRSLPTAAGFEKSRRGRLIAQQGLDFQPQRGIPIARCQ